MRAKPTPRVLVVEDERIIAKDLKRTLERLGYAVPALATSGEEAVRKAAELQPHVVLMDIVLEGELGGIAAAEAIRSELNLPVIFLTAYGDDLTLERARATQPFGYLIKPFEETELRSTIEMAMYKHAVDTRLRESEQWFSTTLRSVGDAVIATDTDGRVVFMNPIAEALTGWRQQEALSCPLKHVFEVRDENNQVDLENPAVRAVREGTVVEFSNHAVVIHRNGGTTPIAHSAAPIRDAKGNITGAVLVFRDITERQRIESQLREANQRMERALEELRVTQRRQEFLAEASMILASTLDYHHTLATVARLAVPQIADLCAVYAVEEDGHVSLLEVAHASESVATLARELLLRHPPSPEVPYGVGKVLLTHQSELIPEIPEQMLALRIRDPEDLQRVRELGLKSMMIVPLKARDRLVGTISLASAQSGRRYTAADLAHAEDLARRAALAIDNAQLYSQARLESEKLAVANRVKVDFLAAVSHELRTPLTSMLGWIHLLAGSTLDLAGRLRALESLERNAQTQARLIDELLDLSQLTTGRMRLELETVELVALVEEALDTVRLAAEAKSIRLKFTGAGGPVRLRCDPKRLQQIVWNLVSNAVKFTPRRGRVEVSVSHDPEHARITVADNGLGIRPQFLPQVFERFAQERATGPQGGLGLGLAIVRQLVELHGGTVTALSDGEGCGATFVVQLPLVPDPGSSQA